MNELVHVDEIAEINELVKPVEYKKEKKSECAICDGCTNTRWCK